MDERRGAGTIAVIGGGASGLAAAIAAARTGAARVTVYEADERVGRSILATGNGRCNFSNARIDAGLYWNGAFVGQVFCAAETLPAQAVGGCAGANSVLRLFASCGLRWREEAQGRLLPATGKASTVLDVLRAAARAAGVREACGNAVCAVELPRREGSPFTLRMADGAFERADAVIVAAGGRHVLDLLPADVEVVPFSPVLGPLKTEVRPIRALDNIRVRCSVRLRRDGAVVAVERGEVLFRKYGVSGIAVFNLSRFARSGDALEIDLLTEALGLREGADAAVALAARRDALANVGMAATCCDVLRGAVLPLVAEALCEVAQVDEGAAPTDEALARIAHAGTAFALSVEGPGDVRQCQAHRGGIAVDALDPQTMALRRTPGLFAAGEAVDVDAPCGGYNLHWAWASGMVAGWSAARR